MSAISELMTVMLTDDPFAVDEVVVLTICHDFEARKRSYALLAEAFDLKPPAEC